MKHLECSPSPTQRHKKRILVLCTGNSARSQMGEALFRHIGGEGWEVHSAGTKPGIVRPEAIEVMKELGLDLTGHRSKSVDEFTGQIFNYVVTVCDNARDNCPVFPSNINRIHWSFEDPAAVEGPEEVRLAAFRRIRDQIHQRVNEFFAKES
jgi:arsenate reductase (thioredoxin)